MLFNTVDFLIFFPLVTIIYFIIPKKVQYIWLLICSYYFYMCWNPIYALLMLFSTAITYLSGLLIHYSNNLLDHKKKSAQKKLWVLLSFVFNLSILFFFKYFDFSVDNINLVLNYFNMEIITPQFDVLLPVGISFYTFQALSYTMDIYRKEVKAETNFAKYALFVSFFPQLVAGPIERSKNLLYQCNTTHFFNYERMKKGLLLMLWGLFQKIVIADKLALVVNEIYSNYGDYGSFYLLIGTFCFAFQIYCDFSSYSDIAVGAAEVLGFQLMQNFKQPYFSTSIAEFWRRWHISLSTWFRDYLYIPLGGNRKGKFRKQMNILLVFLSSGLWHGASWNFVIWGGLNGIYQIIGEWISPLKLRFCAAFKINPQNRIITFLKMVITFLLINFTWIFFRAVDFTSAKEIIVQIFTFDSIFTGTLASSKTTIIIVVFGLSVLLIMDILRSKFKIREKLVIMPLYIQWPLYIMLIYIVFIVAINSLNYPAQQFIYFQF